MSPAESRLFDMLPGPVLVYSCDDDTPVVTGSNAAFRDVFGYAADEVVGRPVADLSAAVETVEMTADELAGRLSEGQSFEAIVPRKKDGADQYFVCRPGRPSEPTDGRVDGLLTYTDVTEVEEERRALVDRVERAESFTDIVAHDLRNPIEVAQIRIDAAEDTGEAVHFEKARSAIERMEDLIASVRTMTLDTEQLATEPVPFSAVVESAWENVDTGTATLVNDISDTRVIQADSSHLQQLLENLLRNSVTHGTVSTTDATSDPPTDQTVGNDVTTDGTNSADLTVQIGPTDTTDDGSDGFYVADTGQGFPAVARDRMFEPGYSSTMGGTGYGLAIVQRIAHAHGWTVTATTSEAGGARFDFTGIEWADSA